MDTEVTLTTKLQEIQRMLQEPPSDNNPSGHDLLNALQTVLLSIEMLSLDVTKQQKEVFERLDTGAQTLEALLKAFIQKNGQVRQTMLSSITSVLPA